MNFFGQTPNQGYPSQNPTGKQPLPFYVTFSGMGAQKLASDPFGVYRPGGLVSNLASGAPIDPFCKHD